MFKSGFRYKYSGVNQERVFNSLSIKYQFFNLKKTSKTSGEFCVSIFDNKKLDKQLEQLNITIEEKKGFGILFYLLQFLKRYGILSAIVIVSVFFVFISNFVFKTQIIGLENITKEQVINILNDNGVKGLVNKNKIDCSYLEKKISNNLNNVSLVSIIVKGNTIVVSIKEKVKNDEFENLDSFQSIKSDYDGVITDIKLVSGTMNVKVGDVVRKGDELVLPYIFDSSGQKRSVEAKAEIYAKVYLKEQESFYDMQIVTQRTGKSINMINLYSLGVKIFSNQKQIELFENYETEKSVKKISLNNILPVYKETITFFETQTIQVKNDFEQKKLEILTNLKQKTLKKVAEYDIIENERQNIFSTAGKNTVEYVLEIKKRIC